MLAPVWNKRTLHNIPVQFWKMLAEDEHAYKQALWGNSQLFMWMLECRVSFCRSPFVYFPLCWGIPLLTTLLTSPAAYQYISRPCSVLTRSMPHKAIYSSFLVPYSFTLSSSLPRHPDSSTSNRRTRRCKEVQKASAIFPYGHASAEPCTHAEQTMQVNMHIL